MQIIKLLLKVSQRARSFMMMSTYKRVKQKCKKAEQNAEDCQEQHEAGRFGMVGWNHP